MSTVTIFDALLVMKDEGRRMRDPEIRPPWGSAPNPALAVRQPGRCKPTCPAAISVEPSRASRGFRGINATMKPSHLFHGPLDPLPDCWLDPPSQTHLLIHAHARIARWFVAVNNLVSGKLDSIDCA